MNFDYPNVSFEKDIIIVDMYCTPITVQYENLSDLAKKSHYGKWLFKA